MREASTVPRRHWSSLRDELPDADATEKLTSGAYQDGRQDQDIYSAVAMCSVVHRQLLPLCPEMRSCTDMDNDT